MQYIVKDTRELAALLRHHAQRLREHKPTTSRADAALNEAMANGFDAAANTVQLTVFEDMPVSEEYRIEYDSAVYYAATQIWASIQRHKGDPRFEYDVYGPKKEFCT